MLYQCLKNKKKKKKKNKTKKKRKEKKRKEVTNARQGKKDGAADNISKQYFEGSYFVSKSN